MKKIVWITWETHIRNRSLCKRFNAELVEILINASPWKRYLISGLKTLRVLWKHRKKVIVTQNPSIVLSFTAAFLKPLFGYKLIVDAHNSGVYPNEGNSPILGRIAQFIIKRANITIVTNKSLASFVQSIGGRSIILPDALPYISSRPLNHPSLDCAKVLFICSWAKDEPYLEVFKAAEKLPAIQFFVTGNSKGREKEYSGLPENINLTGYLPEEDYHMLLATSDIIIDLTTRDDCLVCGAYESIAVKRPFILSNSIALKSYFRSGGIHVNNTAVEIAPAITNIISNYTKYTNDVAQFNLTLEVDWAALFNNAKKEIYGL